MDRTRNMHLRQILAAVVLIVPTGCQSTGKIAQTTTQDAPVSEESRRAVVENPFDPAEFELHTVYFEFNRWELTDETRRVLRSDAQHLQARQASNTVIVMGHCDERGSEEYNLALGERRAEAVKRYLVDLGVPESRIRTRSLGEARPAVAGSGEAAWSLNRRAELSFGTQQASL